MNQKTWLFGSAVLTLVLAGLSGWGFEEARAVGRLRMGAQGLDGLDPEQLEPGLVFQGFEIDKALTLIPDIAEGQLPNEAKIIQQVNFVGQTDNFLPLKDRFVSHVTGYLRLPRSGRYEFQLKSDDGSRLFVDGKQIIDHDGPHATTAKAGEVTLKSGYHALRIEHFDSGGADSLILEWKPPGARAFQLAPPQLFSHRSDRSLETAPGSKELVVPPSPTTGLSRDEAVALSIDLGVEFLLRENEKGIQSEPKSSATSYGQCPFETYALLVAGVSLDHPIIKRNFEYMEEHNFKKKNTYTISCSIFSHDAAIRQIEQDRLLLAGAKARDRVVNDPRIGRPHRKEIKKLTAVLIDGQNPDGGWRYKPREGAGDISCTQFAVLALGIAQERGVQVPLETWLGAAKFCLSMQADNGVETKLRLTLTPEELRARQEVTLQEEDESEGEGSGSGRSRKKRGSTGVAGPRDPIVGTEDVTVRTRGFDYNLARHAGSLNAHWNRTCAGVSSLLIVADRTKQNYPANERAALHAGIRDGYGWLMENWDPFQSFYGIYSLEKVGDLGHVQLFGEIDWYEACTDWLLQKQRSEGDWPATGLWGENQRVTTAFALLVLRRATTLLTRKASEVVIYSGGQEQQKKTELSRRWVFLPEYGTAVHYDQLLRALRYRPSRKLLAVFGEVVDHYEASYRPEIIPSLVGVRGRLEGRAAKKLLDRLLEESAGSELDDGAAYLAWHAKWEWIVRVGDEKQAEAVPELLEAYAKKGASLPLKRAIIRACTQLQARELAPLLVNDLSTAGKTFRASAYRALSGFFAEEPPPFDAEADPRVRAAQIEKIERWLERQS